MLVDTLGWTVFGESSNGFGDTTGLSNEEKSK